MRLVAAREADGAAQIAETVTGFVDDIFRDGLRLHVGRITAGLRDEAGDDAMEDDARVEPFLDVLQERVDGTRRAVSIELDDEVARSRDDADSRCAFRRWRVLRVEEMGRQEQAEQQRDYAHGLRPRMLCLVGPISSTELFD